MSSSFVANPQTAWLLYSEAKAWNTTPAALLTISDPYIGFCFNQAIGYWGGTIEGEMDLVEGKNAKDTAARRKQVLQKWLYPDNENANRGQFADPALMFQ